MSDIENVLVYTDEQRADDAARSAKGYSPAKLRALVDPSLQGGLERYIERGVSTGGFLRAILTNDLFAAIGAASDIIMIQPVCRFLYNDVDARCYGSVEHYRDWLTLGGFVGRKRVEELLEQAVAAKKDGDPALYSFIRRNATVTGVVEQLRERDGIGWELAVARLIRALEKQHG